MGNRQSPGQGIRAAEHIFALWAKPDDNHAVTRAIEGPIDPVGFEGASGAVARNHGLPRFRHCNFAVAYPLGNPAEDPDVPLQVCMEAFNPLIPSDADRSGIPVAVLRFVFTNRSDKTVAASICGSLENFIGWDGVQGKTNGNFNEYSRQARPTGAQDCSCIRKSIHNRRRLARLR